MNPVLVAGDGSRQNFIPRTSNGKGLSGKEFISKEQWRLKFIGNGFEVIDRLGTRYFYTSAVTVNNRIVKYRAHEYKRYYLRDVYDIHNNHIHYDYIGNGIGVTRITASNGAEVNIAYQDISRHKAYRDIARGLLK